MFYIRKRDLPPFGPRSKEEQNDNEKGRKFHKVFAGLTGMDTKILVCQIAALPNDLSANQKWVFSVTCTGFNA
jgi:hypothetical protein